MKQFIIITAMLFILPQLANSQTLAEAFRLSNQRINGTARSSSMGNAFGALGGDFTSLSINPAGIGIYRSGEFVFTPVFKSNNSSLTLNGKEYSENKFQIGASNLGYIGTIKTNGNSGMVSFNFGIGYNNVLDFNQNIYGTNPNSPASFLDNIVNYANAEGLSNSYLNQKIGQIEYRDWPTKLAWDNWLINPAVDNNGNDIDGRYASLLYDNEKVNQRINISQSGGINEFVFAGGFNFNHKFYLGATLGIQNVDLKQLKEYSESFDNNGQGKKNSYTFGEDYSLKGSGYNLKFGAIFKPTDNFRVGLALHTPTYYVLKEDKRIFINSQLKDNNSYEGINLYDYNFFNPWKAVFSGAYVFNKKGLISIDAEYVDYTAMKFERTNQSNSDLSDLNSDIKNGFKSVTNIRVGAEYKVAPQFTLRTGYEMYPGAQLNNNTRYEPVALDKSSVFSFGFGYVSKGFFTDVSIRSLTDKYLLREVEPNFESMNLTRTNRNLLVTFGYKF